MALKQRLRRVAPHSRLSCQENPMLGPARLSKSPLPIRPIYD